MDKPIRFIFILWRIFFEIRWIHEQDDHPKSSLPGSNDIPGWVITDVNTFYRRDPYPPCSFPVNFRIGFPPTAHGREDHRGKVLGETIGFKTVGDFPGGVNIG